MAENEELKPIINRNHHYRNTNESFFKFCDVFENFISYKIKDKNFLLNLLNLT